MSNVLPGLADPKQAAEHGSEALVLYGVHGFEVLFEPVCRRDLGKLQLLEVLGLIGEEVIKNDPFVSHSEVHEGQPVPLEQEPFLAYWLHSPSLYLVGDLEFPLLAAAVPIPRVPFEGSSSRLRCLRFCSR